MISSLRGMVAERLNDCIVLDVGGVGYGVWVAGDDWGRLEIGQEAKVYIYEHIREQAHDLYGFTLIATKDLFEQLLTVNGVGPKMALAVLSIGIIDEVRQAIAEGNVKFLLAANGVGKKVAERIVVDLKDKVGLLAAANATTFLSNPSASNFDEAREALIALGYSSIDAIQSLEGVDSGLTVEERVRLALKGGRK